jgi:hypothetical protein
MEETQGSSGLLKKVLAFAVLILVGLFLLKIIAGFVVGLVVTIFWIAVVVLAVVALIWALRAL